MFSAGPQTTRSGAPTDRQKEIRPYGRIKSDLSLGRGVSSQRPDGRAGGREQSLNSWRKTLSSGSADSAARILERRFD